MKREDYKYLFQINSPQDLKKIPKNELKVVAQEIREYLIDVISEIGGHLGGSLGAVELTIALHYVFNTPVDKIIFDTGHQAYPHKILTGRRDQLPTIRQFKGLSGFLKISESEYDVFGAGHASTSISAGLGIAVARDLKNENFKVISIIGDGALTGGMAYEAMNNAGFLKKNFIVILNDNNMSISKNVSQFSNYFTELISNPRYNKLKANVWEISQKWDEFGDRFRKLVARIEDGVKTIITPGSLFEALGFRYFGPINGHNINQLTKIFEYTKDLNGPILIHIFTQKGKGYKPAEDDSTKLHGVTPFDKITGKSIKSSTPTPPSYTKVFGTTLTKLAKENPLIVGITAAMNEGTGLDILQKELPAQYFDVGIAEEHAVTFAAGLAREGLIPVVAIYSTFLQRAFDQIIHDVALQHLHVVFALDRAGLVGADGPTHHGAFDLSYLRIIPGMVIMAPKDEAELQHMLNTAVNYSEGPIAIRYPRGNGIGVPLPETLTEIEIGKAETLLNGNDVLIIAAGNTVYPALNAAKKLNNDGIYPTVINARFIKPLDEELLISVMKSINKVYIIEENSIVGGLGSAVLELAARNNLKNDFLLDGLPDAFVEHGTQQELYNMLGIDESGIYSKIKTFLST